MRFDNNSSWLNILKILLIFFILDVSILQINAIGSDNNKGILPDSPLYKGEILFEKLNLFFTFNPDAKVKKALNYGNERVFEANIMLNAGKFEKVERAILENSDLIFEINRNIGRIKEDNVETELVEILKMEDYIEEYRFNLEGLRNEVLINGEEKWAEDISKIIEIDRKELKASLESKKTKTMIKVKAVNGFNQSKAEGYLREFERDYGLDEKKKDRIIKSLSRAKDYLLRAKDRLEIAHDRGFNTDNLADRVYKIQREIDNVTIAEEKYDDIKNIARKADDIAINIISEKDGRKFEREFVERADKVLAEIMVIKGEDINRK